MADEKPSYYLTARVYLPTIVSARIICSLGYSESKKDKREMLFATCPITNGVGGDTKKIILLLF
jgi:hypothetical protein